MFVPSHFEFHLNEATANNTAAMEMEEQLDALQPQEGQTDSFVSSPLSPFSDDSPEHLITEDVFSKLAYEAPSPLLESAATWLTFESFG